MGIKSEIDTNLNNNNNNNNNSNNNNSSSNENKSLILDDASLKTQMNENMDIKVTLEEDVDMDKENGTDKQDEKGFEWNDIHNINESDTENPDELYACIAWNDETHAFSHVLESIMSATGYDWERAKKIVDVIHVHGREVIALSNNVDELRKIAAPLAAINLGVTIRPARATFREQVCGLLVEWLKEIISGQVRFFSQIPSGDALIRNILCEELCSEWELRLPLAILTTGSRTNRSASDVIDVVQTGIRVGSDNDTATAPTTTDEFPTIFNYTMAASASTNANNNNNNEDVDMYDPDASSQYQPQFKVGSPASTSSSPVVYRNQCDVATIDWDPAAMVREYQGLRIEEETFGDSLTPHSKSIADGKKPVSVPQETMLIAKNMQKEFEEKLRIDYFMLYDLKLWKEIRISLRELYISSLASNPAYKKILGKRLARNYARLAESFLLKDREPENSIILFSVQLLTVPSVSDILVNQYYFFGLICSTLTAFFLTDHLGLILPSDRSRLPSRVNCESRAFRTRRYFNAFHDLRYIMNVNMIKRVLAEDPLYLRQYIDLIGLFQGMNAQVCQKDTHVEYESEVWVNAFNVTLQLAKCCRQFSDCFGAMPMETHKERVDSAKVLVRAFSRILKKIMDWGIEIAGENNNTNTEETSDQTNNKTKSAPTVYISGLQTQTHHTISLPNMAPFDVIKYDVSSQPVSFHHPLHWLLAGLLEHAHILTEDVLKGAGWSTDFYQAITFFSMPNNESSSRDILLPILEYPIRTIVFSSQIRAGVWVRNGYGLRTQAHHYREISLRENTYDADVFLLQLGLATLPSNLTLVTLMDRFDLVDWFQGDTKHKQYDNTQTVFMVEEILNILIVCICEHSNIIGASMQDKIRREIIHNLCLGLSSYSELTKRIPERLTEHYDFDRILSTVANFKAPDGIHDHGRYELKSECFDEVDTHFWHYSRNNREEAENILKSRWKKDNPNKPDDEFFVIPKLNTITSGPFKYLGTILHTPVIVQMLSYALWNVRISKNHNSDTILDQTLHLIILALIGQNHNVLIEEGFYRHAFEQQYSFKNGDEEPATKEMSLFNVMTLLREDDQFKEAHGRLDWIFSKLENDGFDMTYESIQKWRENSSTMQQKLASESSSGENKSELSEYEKKKQAARERQLKIMAQFAQAQSQFMEQNEGLYDDEGDDMDDQDVLLEQQDDDNDKNIIQRLCSYPVGTCIVCQEDVHEKSAPYGLLGLLQTSNILREVPMNNDKTFNDILSMGPNLDITWPDQQLLADDNAPVPGFPSHLHKTGLYASSCGHLMHIKCFDVYCSSIDSRHSTQVTRNHPENRSRKEFMCPLCKSLGNTLLPLFWKGKKESSVGPFVNVDDATYENFIQYGGYNHIQSLKQLIGPIRPSFYQGRRSSGASKLKETLATWLIGEDRSNRRTNINFSATSPSPLDPASPSSSSSTINQINQHNGSSSSSTLPASQPSSSTTSSNGLNSLFDADIIYSSISNNISAIKKSYSRLMDILSIIHQELCGDDTIKELSVAAKNIDLLWGLLGYTINGVEIATRGNSNSRTNNDMTTENELTGTFFDQIPVQTQMLLRILGDTVVAYTSLMGQPEQPTVPPTVTLTKVHMLAIGRMKQIFTDASVDDISTFILPGLASHQGQDRLTMYENMPLIEDDPFMILVELALHMIPTTQMDIYPLIRVLFLAEITKSVAGIIENGKLYKDDDDSNNVMHLPHPVSEQEQSAMRSFASLIADSIRISSDSILGSKGNIAIDNDDDITNADMAKLSKLVQGFSLPFLRKTLLLLITKFGYIVSSTDATEDNNRMVEDGDSILINNETEFDRLLRLLHLPNWIDILTSIINSNVNNNNHGDHLSKDQTKLVQNWCNQHVRERKRKIQHQEFASVAASSISNTIKNPMDSSSIRPSSDDSNNNNNNNHRLALDLPTPLSLVPLPLRLDRLFDESLQRVCQKCGTVPSDPALCLFCGTFVCCQSFCCSEDEEGECNLHTLECGGDIGIFLSVKRCVLILLHNGNGWFMNAPYLDTHGEVDQGLRRGRPQYLNAKRYAEIKKLWLQHNIPIYVARQIEATYDIGGWTTL
ncbi:unnamed protein product [Cunninghamella blakesleeana]